VEAFLEVEAVNFVEDDVVDADFTTITADEETTLPSTWRLKNSG
jgi:hypothetical protein